MSVETRASDVQIAGLVAVIAEAQAGGKLMDREIALFAEGLRETCGHGKLDALGVQWQRAADRPQREAMAASPGLAKAFAPYLHSRLIQHLSPGEAELETLTEEHAKRCAAAFKMGIQGVIRWRAEEEGKSTVHPDTTAVKESLCPIIRLAANDFFAERLAAV
jgi:hypothetical protein